MKKTAIEVARTKNILLITIIGVILVTILVALYVNHRANNQPSPSSEDTTAEVSIRRYSASHIASDFSSRYNCWTIIDKKVYSVTDFILSHPGVEELEKACGQDGKEFFENQGEYQKISEGDLPETIIQEGILYEVPSVF